MMLFYSCFRYAQLFLHNFRLYSQIRQLISQPLSLYPQHFSLLFAYPHLLLHHHPAFNSHIVFRFDVFE